MIDTHAHVYHERLAHDLPEVVARAQEAGVTRVLLPAIDVPSIHQALALCDQYPGYHAMSAIHPTDVQDATESDWDAVAGFCADPRVVAVGETGLDYYWDRTFDERQQSFLRRHIRLARDQNLPIVLHLRDKAHLDDVHRDAVRILAEEYTDRMRGVFHCFTGPAWVAEAATALGFYLGIGGVVTFKNAGVDKLVSSISMDRLVLETDAPFVTPAPHRGKRNEPAYLSLVAAKLAAVKGLSVDEVVRITTDNARGLFDI